jgi:hypothetical protein
VAWSVNEVVTQPPAKSTAENLRRRKALASKLHPPRGDAGLNASHDPSVIVGKIRAHVALWMLYLFRFLKEMDIRVYSSILRSLCSTNMACAPNALMDANPENAALTDASTGAYRERRFSMTTGNTEADRAPWR